MIRVSRTDLPDPTVAKLTSLTNRIAEKPEKERVGQARTLWANNVHVKKSLRQHLHLMCHNYRCMYCGDNEGTDIDHYEPISFQPVRAFTWPNHLLARSVCNSSTPPSTIPSTISFSRSPSASTGR